MRSFRLGYRGYPRQNRLLSERVNVLKKSRIMPDRHGHFIKRVGVGFLAVGILSVCLAVPHSAFADAAVVDSMTAAVVPEPSVADPNTFSQAALSVDADPEPSPQAWRVVRMRVTAYCPCSQCCGEYADGITACNHHIHNGDRFVAADKTFAFGTEMVIPGYNSSQPVEVKDRGGAIRGDRLDVFFNTHQEALEWGVQYLDVRIKSS